MNPFLKKLALNIPQLRNLYEQNQKLEKELGERRAEREQIFLQKNDLSEEIQRLYHGNHGLMGEISYLKNELQTMIDLHDDVVNKKWDNDYAKRKWSCVKPFDSIIITPRGEVYNCCGMFLKYNHYIGNAFTQTLEEIWNSDKAKRLRYSVLNGDYEFCNNLCELNQERNWRDGEPIITKSLVKKESLGYDFKKWQDCTLYDGPKKIYLECDDSCNLHCFTCRTKVKVCSKETSDKLYSMMMNFVRPALKDCTLLFALGSGEFFASDSTMRFYKTLSKEEFPNLKIDIQTNAVLCTRDKMGEFDNLKGMLHGFTVSIDAACKETYEKIRRGASWDKLCSNMEYISSLKAKGEIEFIQMNFVVQKDNYMQMNSYIDLAKKWNASSVSFQRFMSMGALDEKEFKVHDVFDPENPYYEEARSIMLEAKKRTDGIIIYENVL